MTLKQFLTKFNGFLVDASGVLYERSEFFKFAATTFNYLQELAPTFLATNNSYMFPTDIVSVLHHKVGIVLKPENIISSGHGLIFDEFIQSAISDKRLYIVGSDSALKYFNDTVPHTHTNSIKQAQAIVLMSYSPHQDISFVDEIIDVATKDKHLPVICCNWDRHIRSGNSLMPVIGTLAQQIEDAINRPIYWFGKPMKNYSELVSSRLNQSNLKTNETILFFDDNINNVVSMQQHIGITGCWVKSTGIYFNQSNDDLFSLYGKPHFFIDSFDLNSTVINTH